jgi:predicted ATPase
VIAAIVHQPVPALGKACPEASAGLIDLTLRLLAREPKERPSARQVSAMLEALSKDRAPLEVLRSQAIAPTDYRPGAASQPRLQSALPAATAPFFGRSDEMAALRRLLAHPSARLVTILGPGGVGKSRLAIEVVRSLESLAPGAGEYRDGIYFIDLTTVSTPELLASALGRALSVVLAPGGDAGEQLLDRLRDKELLLLLDNFEHLVNAASFATKLLQAAPRLKILATSREALRVSTETRFVLAGLPMPEALEHDASAVQLFVDCARRVRRDFDARSEWPAVARVCRLVQGMPLGIVLAASWTGVLSSDEIAHEIEQSLDFVRADLRDLPDRQRSLRAVFEHSWNLLGADERELFARLSVFRGGFARSAARAVAGATAETLAGLVAKSLLDWQPVAARFVMHELLREYGEAELRSHPPEKLQTMDRLAAYYADFLRDQQAALLGAGQPQAIVQITVELGNVNAAWQWMLERRDLVGLEKALFGLALFHARCGSPGEVEATYDEVVRVFTPLEQGSQLAQKVLGIALLCQSVSCEYQGRNPAAVELLKRAMQALSEAGDCRERALALILQGWILRDVQTADTRIASTEEGLAMYRKDGDLPSLALLLVQAARVCEGAADLPRAEGHLRESLALQRSLHRGVIVLPSSLYGLGMLRGRQGAWRESYVLIAEGLEAAERIGDKWSVAEALRHVALAQANLGDFSAAEAMTRRCIGVCREIGAQELHAQCLSNLGDIAKRQGQLNQACDHYTEAFALTRGGSVQRAGVDLNLGELALLRGRHDEAERHLVQGLGIFLARQVDWGIIIASDRLGTLACKGGRHQAARQHFVQALGLALRARRWSLVLDVITGFALLHAGGRRDTRAVELLGLARHHPATDKLTLALRVQPLLGELADRIPGPEFSAALERGQRLDLEECARACAEDGGRVSGCQ